MIKNCKSWLIVSFGAFFLALYFLVFGFSKAEISFQTYPNLTSKNISVPEMKQVLEVHRSCFDKDREKNHLAYSKKYRFVGQDEELVKSVVKRELQQLRRQQKHSFQYTENITVLRENKKIVGLYSCQEEGESLDNGIYIWNLCVSPKSRGKGYGTKLTQHAIKSCSKAGHELKLLVYKDNTRAQYIYKKQGFKFDNWDYDVDSEENFYNKHRMKFIKKALPHQD